MLTHDNKQLQERTRSLEDQNSGLQTENQRYKQSEQLFISANEQQLLKVKQQEDELLMLQAESKEQTQELKRYETTVSYMTRQLDEEKLRKLEQ